MNVLLLNPSFIAADDHVVVALENGTSLDLPEVKYETDMGKGECELRLSSLLSYFYLGMLKLTTYRGSV